MQNSYDAKNASRDIEIQLRDEMRNQPRREDNRIVEDLQEKKRQLEKDLTIQKVAAQEAERAQVRAAGRRHQIGRSRSSSGIWTSYVRRRERPRSS